MDVFGGNIPSAGMLQVKSAYDNVKTKEIQDLNELKYSSSLTDKEKLKGVAQEFESIFVKMMLDEMNKTVDEGDEGLLGKSMAGDIFKDMLTSERSKAMSKTSSFGIAQTIYDQLSNPGIKPSEIEKKA